MPPPKRNETSVTPALNSAHISTHPTRKDNGSRFEEKNVGAFDKENWKPCHSLPEPPPTIPLSQQCGHMSRVEKKDILVPPRRQGQYDQKDSLTFAHHNRQSTAAIERNAVRLPTTRGTAIERPKQGEGGTQSVEKGKGEEAAQSDVTFDNNSFGIIERCSAPRRGDETAGVGAAEEDDDWSTDYAGAPSEENVDSDTRRLIEFVRDRRNSAVMDGASRAQQAVKTPSSSAAEPPSAQACDINATKQFRRGVDVTRLSTMPETSPRQESPKVCKHIRGRRSQRQRSKKETYMDANPFIGQRPSRRQLKRGGLTVRGRPRREIRSGTAGRLDDLFVNEYKTESANVAGGTTRRQLREEVHRPVRGHTLAMDKSISTRLMELQTAIRSGNPLSELSQADNLISGKPQGRAIDITKDATPSPTRAEPLRVRAKPELISLLEKSDFDSRPDNAIGRKASSVLGANKPLLCVVPVVGESLFRNRTPLREGPSRRSLIPRKLPRRCPQSLQDMVAETRSASLPAAPATTENQKLHTAQFGETGVFHHVNTEDASRLQLPKQSYSPMPQHIESTPIGDPMNADPCLFPSRRFIAPASVDMREPEFPATVHQNTKSSSPYFQVSTSNYKSANLENEVMPVAQSKLELYQFGEDSHGDCPPPPEMRMSINKISPCDIPPEATDDRTMRQKRPLTTDSEAVHTKRRRSNSEEIAKKSFPSPVVINNNPPASHLNARDTSFDYEHCTTTETSVNGEVTPPRNADQTRQLDENQGPSALRGTVALLPFSGTPRNEDPTGTASTGQFGSYDDQTITVPNLTEKHQDAYLAESEALSQRALLGPAVWTDNQRTHCASAVIKAVLSYCEVTLLKKPRIDSQLSSHSSTKAPQNADSEKENLAVSLSDDAKTELIDLSRLPRSLKSTQWMWNIVSNDCFWKDLENVGGGNLCSGGIFQLKSFSEESRFELCVRMPKLARLLAVLIEGFQRSLIERLKNGCTSKDITAPKTEKRKIEAKITASFAEKTLKLWVQAILKKLEHSTKKDGETRRNVAFDAKTHYLMRNDQSVVAFLRENASTAKRFLDQWKISIDAQHDFHLSTGERIFQERIDEMSGRRQLCSSYSPPARQSGTHSHPLTATSAPYLAGRSSLQANKYQPNQGNKPDSGRRSGNDYSPPNKSHCSPVNRPHYSPPNKSHCSPVNRPHCSPINRPHCSPINRPHCSPINRPHCSPINRPHCSPVNRPHCSPVNRPHCSPVNRPHCSPVNRRAPARPDVSNSSQGNFLLQILQDKESLSERFMRYREQKHAKLLLLEKTQKRARQTSLFEARVEAEKNEALSVYSVLDILRGHFLKDTIERIERHYAATASYNRLSQNIESSGIVPPYIEGIALLEPRRRRSTISNPSYTRVPHRFSILSIGSNNSPMTAKREVGTVVHRHTPAFVETESTYLERRFLSVSQRESTRSREESVEQRITGEFTGAGGYQNSSKNHTKPTETNDFYEGKFPVVHLSRGPRRSEAILARMRKSHI